MNTRIYVDNLAATITEKDLMDLFSAYGNVVAINIAVDPINARRRGFGLVTMVTPEGARAAIEALNGRTVGAATLTVSEGSLNRGPAGLRKGRGNPRRRPSHLY